MSFKTNKINQRKNNKTNKLKINVNKGGNEKPDLTQKYSLDVLEQNGKNGFSFSNILLGLIAVGTLIFMINKNGK